MYKIKRCRKKELLLLNGNFFVCQNGRKYNQILETELNLNDIEKLTIEDEIKIV